MTTDKIAWHKRKTFMIIWCLMIFASGIGWGFVYGWHTYPENHPIKPITLEQSISNNLSLSKITNMTISSNRTGLFNVNFTITGAGTPFSLMDMINYD
jgi:hypothetical protein